MRFLFVVILVILGANILKAQYWFGPTAGAHLTDHSYQSTTYDTDSFNVKPDWNFHVGGSFFYTANKTYSVYSEIVYERVSRVVKNVPGVTTETRSSANYHFLSIPLNLRVNYEIPGTLVTLYGGGGIKLSWWMGGNGEIDLEEFQEYFTEEEIPLEYKIVYRQSKSDGLTTLAQTDAHRIIYSLQGGGGVMVNITDHSRIVGDFRFTFGHSNMGFNGSPDFTWAQYYENFEYRHHMYSLSLSYIIEFNAQLAMKGKSVSGK